MDGMIEEPHVLLRVERKKQGDDAGCRMRIGIYLSEPYRDLIAFRKRSETKIDDLHLLGFRGSCAEARVWNMLLGER
jgi:hypothetical protein